MSDAHAAYRQLVKHSRERGMLTSCLELLGWDELTYMPAGAVEYRGRVMAYLAGLDHARGTDPRVGELLSMVEASDLLTSGPREVAANVRRWRRDHQQLTRVPRLLIEELAAVTASAQRAWADARQNSRFDDFSPWLQRIVDLKREEAQCRYATAAVYDGLLQEYEPHVTTADLQGLFEELRQELTKLVDAIRGAPQRTSDALLHREYSIERQRIFAETIASDLGFDFHRGRLDATTHPFFAAVGPGDCRITTRYSTHDFGDAFCSMLHEAGHGLYEQGLDPELYGTPAGEAPSTAIHESQSQLWEKFVGRSRPFWDYIFPRARDVFHDVLHGVKVDEFYRAVNHVDPSWNRVRADPASYDLHILIRFELEVALLNGQLPVSGLPEAWNAAYQRHLDVTPEDDAQGCLQDGHWSAGMFGYFPVYTLGNIYAAQFHAAAREAITEFDLLIARGDFGPLLDWLRVNIYGRAGIDDPPSLFESVTGQPPSYRPLIEALWSRYRPIYGL